MIRFTTPNNAGHSQVTLPIHLMITVILLSLVSVLFTGRNFSIFSEYVESANFSRHEFEY